MFPHTFQIRIIFIFVKRITSILNFWRQRLFDPCRIIFDLLPNIHITLFFALFPAQIGAMLHQSFTRHLVHFDEALLSIITAWSDKHRLSISFAVYRVIFESLFLIKIASNLLFWRFAFYYGLFICNGTHGIFVKGKVTTFVSLGCVSVFRSSFIWGSEIQ